MRHKLTDAAIRAAGTPETPRKLFDGDGLFLLLNPNGSRWWRFKYRYGGKEKLISLGTYPDVSLKRAREKATECRQVLDRGTDPSVKRKIERVALGETFEAVAREYFAKQATELAPQTIKRDMDRLEMYAFPVLGHRPVSALSAAEFLAMLRPVEAKGKLHTAHRIRGACSRIMRFAKVAQLIERNPVVDLAGALASRKEVNHAALTDPREVGGLLRAMDGYSGQPTTIAALRLAPLVFLRPVELRRAEWREFILDGNNPIWTIPGRRMKMREEHLVPLSRQAVAILNELRPLTGWGQFVFPSLRTKERPISENTLNAALRRLGYSKDEQTSHGFRTVASTLLNEQGYHWDVIEVQLAHQEKSKSRRAYNRAKYLPERRAMMQDWADYLDALKAGGTVVPFRKRKAIA